MTTQQNDQQAEIRDTWVCPNEEAEHWIEAIVHDPDAPGVWEVTCGHCGSVTVIANKEVAS